MKLANDVDSQTGLLLRAATQTGPAALAAWDAWNAHGELPEKMFNRSQYRLLPHVHQNLLPQAADVQHMARLAGIRRKAWVDNQILLRDCLPVLQRAQQHGIPIMLLKGVALAPFYYRDWGVRILSDIDVMTTPAHVPALRACCTSLGWQNTGNFRAERDARAFTAGHSSSFSKSAKLGIDLHWHLTFAATFSAAEQGVWEAAEPVELLGVPVYIPCPADLLLQVCIHGAVADPNGTSRWAMDAITILKMRGHDMDWTRLLARARAWSTVAMLREALNTLSSQFAVQVPVNVLAELARSPVDRAEKQFALAMATSPQSLPGKVSRFASLRRWHVWQARRNAEIPVPLLQHLQFWFGETSLSGLLNTLFVRSRAILHAH